MTAPWVAALPAEVRSICERIEPLAEKAETGLLSFADVNRLHGLVLDFALAVAASSRESSPRTAWPEAVSDGLTLPCADCGEVPRFDYRVTHAFWDRWVPDLPERLGVVCLPCLDRRCGGVGLGDALCEVQWTGTDHTVVLRPSLVWLYARVDRQTEGGRRMTVGRYDDNTWAVYDSDGTVLRHGFFESQDAYDWIESQPC